VAANLGSIGKAPFPISPDFVAVTSFTPSPLPEREVNVIGRPALAKPVAQIARPIVPVATSEST